ncbi:tyrosine-type recombinase/integrase [Nannocystaceae bacterium ST9]
MSYTIRPFRSGGWEVDIVITYPNGEKFRERRKAPVETKTAAKRWAQERERFLFEHGRPQPRGKGKSTNEEATKPKPVPTLAEFMPRYFEYCKANRQKPATRWAKELTCRNHLIPAFGDMRLDRFTAEHVEQLKERLAEYSAKTVNNALAIFNTILKVAVHLDVLEQVPVSAKWLKTTLPRMPFYDFDEYARLRAAARRIDARCELVVMLAGDAGLRSAEIRALQWTALDFSRRLITVERSYSLDEIVMSKSDRIRTIPMTPRLREALLAYREGSEHTNVILNNNGEPPSPANIRTWLNNAQRDADVLVKGPHTLRHTFCSHLVMTGAHMLEVKTLAGHADLETTMRYMHLAPEALHGAMHRLQGGLVGRFGDGVETMNPPRQNP